MQHDPPALTDTEPPASLLQEACVHLDIAAQQLVADQDAFSPNITMAGQLRLLRAGIQPGSRAVLEANDRDGALDHLDHALALLHILTGQDAAADLHVWTVLLTQLRPAVEAATRTDDAPRPNQGARS